MSGGGQTGKEPEQTGDTATFESIDFFAAFELNAYAAVFSGGSESNKGTHIDADAHWIP
ncbi:hypothetical protein AOE01nite_17640 [Acetobacter oeni]|uniref:Uncharacterized protein n=2 Tax=Acetobacter oeni TaxID=304077 RepID=A0A511XKS1_9PROT|nr:hypothetical protein AOE01nite_17640 [Acetobacter oeni]